MELYPKNKNKKAFQETLCKISTKGGENRPYNFTTQGISGSLQ
jgi:hypothetical protein